VLQGHVPWAGRQLDSWPRICKDGRAGRIGPGARWNP